MKRLFEFFGKLYWGCDEFVEGYPVVRDKEKPWLCYVTSATMNRSMFVDRKHPDYTQKHLLPILSQFDGYELINGKMVKTNSEESYNFKKYMNE
jgi:hypothetical protein